MKTASGKKEVRWVSSETERWCVPRIDNYTPHLAFGLKHGHYWLLYAKAAGVEVECSAGLEIFVIMNALPFDAPDGVFRQHWTLTDCKLDLYQ